MRQVLKGWSLRDSRGNSLLRYTDVAETEEVCQALMDAVTRISEQVKQELMHDLKKRELELKERELAAREKLMQAQTVQTGVQSSYSAMQGAAQVAQMPMIAPIADAIMQGAGYQKPIPGGDDPDFPTPDATAAVNMPHPYIQGGGQSAVPGDDEGSLSVRENTSPAFPPVPQAFGAGMDGIETAGAADNLPV